MNLEKFCQSGINRNILECKFARKKRLSSVSSSINRNILECKSGIHLILPVFFQVLIETYWNVNEIKDIIMFFPDSVLIETYWNVNIESIFPGSFKMAVLIETYWNVNVLQHGGLYKNLSLIHICNITESI